MSRTAGTRNADYEAHRQELAAAVARRMVAPGGAAASFRELAAAAGVSAPTLRHYFGDRTGVMGAALAELRRQGAMWIAYTADPGEGDARTSLESFFASFLLGWRQFGVGTIQAAALSAGLTEAAVGPAYLTEILEPVLQALEQRIEALAARGEIVPGDLRVAALELLAPVFLALLHQDALSGTRCRPLDMDSFVRAHLDHTLRAWAPERRYPGA